MPEMLQAVGTAMTRDRGRGVRPPPPAKAPPDDDMGARGACFGRLKESSKPEFHLEDRKVFREEVNRELQARPVASSGSNGPTLGQVLEPAPTSSIMRRQACRAWGDLWRRQRSRQLFWG